MPPIPGAPPPIGGIGGVSSSSSAIGVFLLKSLNL